MDIGFLDDLENKVQSLINQLDEIRNENTSLKQEIADSGTMMSDMESENNRLKQELEATKNSSVEQQSRLDSVTERIQGIISRLESVQ